MKIPSDFYHTQRNMLYAYGAIVLFACTSAILCHSLILAVIIISLPLAYRFSSIITSADLFDSKVMRLLLSVFVYFIVLQMAILSSWLISKNFPLTDSVYLAFTLLVLINILIRKKSVVKIIPILRASDIYSFIGCIIILTPLILAPLYHARSADSGQILSLIATGVDDASHISLLNDRIQFNRGVIYKSDAVGDVRSDIILSYPAGWHSANAIIAKSINPNISAGTSSIIFYVISKIFWFGLLIFFAIRTIFIIYSRFYKSKASTLAAVSILIFSITLYTWTLSDTFIEGFYSFIPQLLIIPLFILALLHIPKFELPSDAKVFYESLAFPILLCAAATFSWLLLTPVFAISLLLAMTLRTKHPLEIITRLRHFPLYVLLVAVVALLAVFVQIISAVDDNSTSFIQSLLTPGGIITYPFTLYLFVIAAASIFFVTVSKKMSRELQIMLVLLTILAIFVTFVYLVQQYYTQSNAYYYFKSLNTLTFAACILGIAFLAYLFQNSSQKYGKITTGLYVTLLSCALIQFIYPNPAIYSYARGIYSTTPAINHQIWDALSTTHTQENYNDKQVTMYYPASNPGLKEVATMLLKSNKPSTTCFNTIRLATLTTPISSFSTSPIQKNCTHGESITYLVDSSDVAMLKGIIEQQPSLSATVTIKAIQY